MATSAVEYLRHILEEADFLIEQSKGTRKENFIQDSVLKRAFVRSLEIIAKRRRICPRLCVQNIPQSIGATWPACETVFFMAM